MPFQGFVDAEDQRTIAPIQVEDQQSKQDPGHLHWTLRNSSGVGKGIDKSVVHSGRDFPYIRVGGGQ